MTPQARDVVLVGASLPMHKLRSLIARVAPTRLPVLIEGETGTGKELVAALLHQQSRQKGPLVSFNVCAIGETMFEDALFGHVRGAYTGAHVESLGFLREAHEGTVFLDEISGLSLPLQAKLLRAIETGVFRPIGATRDARSDFRVVTATNERLSEAVARGAFRADLHHRLSGVVVSVPSLGERVEDIPELARHFLRRLAGDARGATGINQAAIDLLMSVPWSGNVRELKQVVETAGAFANDVVGVSAVESALSLRSAADETLFADIQLNERRRIFAVLRGAGWDVGTAAAQLGLHRATLYRRMKRHGIEAPRLALGGAVKRPSVLSLDTALS